MLWRLSEKVVYQASIVFVFDPREQSRAQLSDRRRIIEWQTIVHLPAAEVTWHALRLKDRF